jgi:hypothetical protein
MDQHNEGVGHSIRRDAVSRAGSYRETLCGNGGECLEQKNPAASFSHRLWSASAGGARPLRVSDVIAVKNARSRREASRIDVDLRVFELVFFSDTLLGVADSERAAFWDPETGEPSVEFTRFGIGRVS